jgi:multisubunit Na+/H+ antiporter MnhC subunit
LHDITPNVITSIVISFFIVHPVVKNTPRIYKKTNTKQEME